MRGMEVIPHIQEALFSMDIARKNEMYVGLVEENMNFGGNHAGFLFKGKFWTHLVGKQQAGVQKVHLARELWDKGTEMAELSDFLTKSHQRTQQWLINLLRGAPDLQEARNLLPDSITLLMPMFAEIPRTKPVGFHLTGKPLSKHTYDDLSNLIGSYAANKIIY